EVVVSCNLLQQSISAQSGPQHFDREISLKTRTLVGRSLRLVSLDLESLFDIGWPPPITKPFVGGPRGWEICDEGPVDASFD
ncbi:hypothetical protein THAOC_19028, partial [Thalassiosira oceanica]